MSISNLFYDRPNNYDLRIWHATVDNGLTVNNPNPDFEVMRLGGSGTGLATISVLNGQMHLNSHNEQTVCSTNFESNNIRINDGINMVSPTGIMNINSTIDSDNNTNGALIIKGGVGISKNVNIGGELYASSIVKTNGTVILQPVALAGAIIATTNIRWTNAFCPNIVIMVIARVNAVCSADTNQIYTASGIVPQQYRPIAGQSQIINIFSNGIHSTGFCIIMPDGTVIIKNSGTWNIGEANTGFPDTIVQYNMI